MPRFSLFLLILWLPLVVGCEGCRDDSGTADKEDKEKAPLEDFSVKIPSAFPADLSPLAGGIKPGHWLTASQPLKSNKVDARGELMTTASVSGESFRSGQSQTISGAPPSIRPIVLPKGQMRRFDYRILAPVPPNQDNKKSFLASRFVSSARATFYNTGRQPFNVLAGQEFFFVILTNRPERFAKFQVSDWVQPPKDQYEFDQLDANYQIVIPPVDDILPLAETMLDWTGTAVLFWDDLSPDALTPTQQTAIADWIRFGGQLIVNGAAGSDAIANSTLADVLPLKPTGNIELDAGAATELLKGHQVAGDPSTEKQISLVQDQSARLAVDGIAAADAVDVAKSGKLLLERTVGRGRVVQARFDLTGDWISNWKSYHSFVNGALLRRPRRRYMKPNESAPLRQIYPDGNFGLGDPTVNSRFRISARDAILPVTIQPETEPSSASGETKSILSENDQPTTAGERARTTQSALASRNDALTRISSMSGISSWTDTSDAVAICTQILRDESGIEIPDSSLVVRSLGYYLLLLVPVNYLIFRLLGRLEYAWLAVPLFAIGGAIWVARAARLDIGFARSQTQVAMLEVQPGYHRGHLSRIVAIYNSLSSSYDIEFSNGDAVAAPIHSANDTIDQTVLKTGYADGPILAGLAVGSNQVRMLHAEQLIDLGGSIELTADGQLINTTDYTLLDAHVIEKSDSGDLLVSSLGQCDSGSSQKLRRKQANSASVADDLPMQTGQFIRRLASPEAMHNGTSRLIARIDGALPGMSIAPQANQALSQTVVLAHLKHRSIPTAEVDENLIGEFADVLTEEDETNEEVLQ